MDAAAEPGVEAVIVKKSAQIGWTEIVGNVAGYYIDQDPAPIIVIQPTLEMAEAWSKDRLAPMLRDTPALADKIRDPRSRDSGNTLLHKVFAGGNLTIGGANSPAGLASRPKRIVVCDEVDRYPRSAGAEGDPVNLVRKRSLTFWNKMFFAGSTPTIKGVSRIDELYNASDQRQFFVPCPDCAEPQILKWSQVKWPEGRPGEAVYVCEHCGSIWDDVTRWRAIAEAESRGHGWRPMADFDGTAGFWLWEAYSPWTTLGEMARSFLEAKKLPETLQTFVNTTLAQVWELEGTTLEPDPLLERRENYGADPVPAGVVLITAGVDVQEDRLELEIVGWGADEESWNLDYRILRGDPGDRELWRELDEILLERYTSEDGRALRIEAACVDSGGHYTDEVYKFCGRRRRRRVWAIKGMFGQGRPIWPRTASRTKKSRAPLFVIGVDTAKDRVYSRLAIAEPGPGYCHFPTHRDLDYFHQLTAEKCVTKYVRGHPTLQWIVKTDGAANEALDCRVYAMAARYGRGVDLNRRTERIRARLEEPETVPEPDPPLEEPPTPAPPARPRTPRTKIRSRRRGFVHR